MLVKQAVSTAYGFTVYVNQAKALPKEAFVTIKSPRYRADSLLAYQLRLKPDTIGLILGLTSKDISTTKRDRRGNIKAPESRYADWGVFGLGYRPGASCVVSTFRLNSASPQFEQRLQKVAIHEVGHNLGLSHCDKDKRCVMQDAAESIKTIDRVGLSLCNGCQRDID